MKTLSNYSLAGNVSGVSVTHGQPPPVSGRSRAGRRTSVTQRNLETLHLLKPTGLNTTLFTWNDSVWILIIIKCCSKTCWKWSQRCLGTCCIRRLWCLLFFLKRDQQTNQQTGENIISQVRTKHLVEKWTFSGPWEIAKNRICALQFCFFVWFVLLYIYIDILSEMSGVSSRVCCN